MLLPLLLDVAVPVSSADVSFQVISYRTSRKVKNGPVMCAMDPANKTMTSSSLQDCSLSCARDAACKSFNTKNSLTCDHVMSPVLASTPRTQTPAICMPTKLKSSHLSPVATTIRLVSVHKPSVLPVFIPVVYFPVFVSLLTSIRMRCCWRKLLNCTLHHSRSS